jgi:PadR family transcriptional regulator PadR
MPKRYQHRIELLQGTLDLIILQTLRSGALHGYGITQAIASGSSDLLQVDTGSLYPALHRLEKRGWLKSAWKVSEHKQRAKYYQLTAAGKKQLASEHTRWADFVSAMSGILEPRKSEG